jgi:hypothetical protein
MSRKRGASITMAEFKRVWSDRSITIAQIGEMLGVSQQAVSLRAAKRGLPPRGYPVERFTIIRDVDLFKRMWLADVRGADICAHFGAAPDTLRHAVRRHNLPKRGKGRIRTIRLPEFWEMEMARKLAEDASKMGKAAA